MNAAQGHYDSRPDTWAHISRVRELLGDVAKRIIARAAEHDRSKLSEPELSIFNEFTPKLRDSTYGSEKYKDFRKRTAAVVAAGCRRGTVRRSE